MSTESTQTPADRNDALQLNHLDPQIPATEDLFRHANGAWLKTAEIPDDQSWWGPFLILNEQSRQAVRQIVDELTPDDDPGTEHSKIANLYASFMAEDRIEELGIEPLAELLARVDAIESLDDLMRHWGWSLRHGIGWLGSMDNDADPGDPKRYLMFVGQSGIGLPDEEYYRLDQHAEIREAYQAHLVKMFELAGISDASEQAGTVFELETEIAAYHWDKVRLRDLVQMYHPQTWDEFCAETPNLNWDEFLAGAQLPVESVATVVNAQHTFWPAAAELVTEARLPAWRAWSRWQLIDALAPFLTEALVMEDFDFNARKLSGTPQIQERWKRGVKFTQAVLGEAIGKIYVDKHFPADHKAAAQELVENLIEAYRRSIVELDWMTDATRQEALTKLANFRYKIGYPDKWRDYGKLEIVPGDLVGNVLRANSFELDHTIEQLSGPVDKDEWLMLPQLVNAYYHPLRNEIVFPAAILQPPFFSPDADDAVNYGGIGAVIGHEIGHGFDDEGSTCDGEGRLRNWWTDEDRAAFEQRTAALVDQFSALHPSEAPELSVNGELTLGENIGDLGGLSIAYDAWQIACDGAQPEPINGLSGAQRLFLSWAQVWNGLFRPEDIREQIATDPHSPHEFRCNQIVRNIPQFHEAFDTKPGDAMWLAPEERVSIW